MELRPILSAMRRNKLGPALIGMQMTFTLAILANGLTLIQQRLMWSDRPTGIDEPDIFVCPAKASITCKTRRRALPPMLPLCAH
jgi:hypothetical protein